MQILFLDDALKEIYETGKTSDSKYKNFCRNKKLVNGYRRVIITMYSVNKTDELYVYSFLHYEKLRHVNKSSVRILNGFIERLIFTEEENKIEVTLIEIDNTHYGNK